MKKVAGAGSGNGKVPMGFTRETFPRGIHMCYIYSDEVERNKTILQFLESGLANGEKAAYFADVPSIPELERYGDALGLTRLCEKHGERFCLATTRDVYYPDGTFVPDEMLDRLDTFYTESIQEGFTGVRVVGEASWLAGGVPGSSRFMEYEARVNNLKCPVNAICLYDAHLFDGATLRDVLAVHPMIVVQKQIVKNPYYIKSAWLLRKYLGLDRG